MGIEQIVASVEAFEIEQAEAQAQEMGNTDLEALGPLVMLAFEN